MNEENKNLKSTELYNTYNKTGKGDPPDDKKKKQKLEGVNYRSDRFEYPDVYETPSEAGTHGKTTNVDLSGFDESYRNYLDPDNLEQAYKIRADSQSFGGNLLRTIGNGLINIPIGLAESYAATSAPIEAALSGDPIKFDNENSRFIAEWKNPFGETYTADPSDPHDFSDSGFYWNMASGLITTIGEFALVGKGVSGAINSVAKPLSSGLRGKAATRLSKSMEAARKVGNRSSKGIAEYARLNKGLTGTANIVEGAGAQTMSSILTSSYGARMYSADVYNNLYDQAIDAGKDDDEAKDIASLGGSKAFVLGTAAASLSNFGIMKTFFNKNYMRNNMFKQLGIKRKTALKGSQKVKESLPNYRSRLDALKNTREYKNYISGGGRKEYAKESIKEGFEESFEGIAEEYGLASGEADIYGGIDHDDIIRRAFNSQMSKEGLTNFLAGMAGGVGHKVALSRFTGGFEYKTNEQGNKIKREKSSKNPFKSEYEKYWISTYKKNKKEREEQLDKYLKPLKEDLERVQDLDKQLEDAVVNNEDPSKIEDIKDKLFDVNQYNSITLGLGQELAADLENIANLDNTKDVTEDLVQERDQIQKDLNELKSNEEVANTEEGAELIADSENKIKALNEQIKEDTGKTEAMKHGYAKSKEDNRYKEEARRFAELTKETEEFYELMKDTYGSEKDIKYNVPELILREWLNDRSNGYVFDRYKERYDKFIEEYKVKNNVPEEDFELFRQQAELSILENLIKTRENNLKKDLKDASKFVKDKTKKEINYLKKAAKEKRLPIDNKRKQTNKKIEDFNKEVERERENLIRDKKDKISEEYIEERNRIEVNLEVDKNGFEETVEKISNIDRINEKRKRIKEVESEIKERIETKQEIREERNEAKLNELSEEFDLLQDQIENYESLQTRKKDITERIKINEESLKNIDKLLENIETLTYLSIENNNKKKDDAEAISIKEGLKRIKEIQEEVNKSVEGFNKNQEALFESYNDQGSDMALSYAKAINSLATKKESQDMLERLLDNKGRAEILEDFKRESEEKARKKVEEVVNEVKETEEKIEKAENKEKESRRANNKEKDKKVKRNNKPPVIKSTSVEQIENNLSEEGLISIDQLFEFEEFFENLTKEQRKDMFGTIKYKQTLNIITTLDRNLKNDTKAPKVVKEVYTKTLENLKKAEDGNDIGKWISIAHKIVKAKPNERKDLYNKLSKESPVELSETQENETSTKQELTEKTREQPVETEKQEGDEVYDTIQQMMASITSKIKDGEYTDIGLQTLQDYSNKFVKEREANLISLVSRADDKEDVSKVVGRINDSLKNLKGSFNLTQYINHLKLAYDLSQSENPEKLIENYNEAAKRDDNMLIALDSNLDPNVNNSIAIINNSEKIRFNDDGSIDKSTIEYLNMLDYIKDHAQLNSNLSLEGTFEELMNDILNTLKKDKLSDLVKATHNISKEDIADRIFKVSKGFFKNLGEYRGDVTNMEDYMLEGLELINNVESRREAEGSLNDPFNDTTGIVLNDDSKIKKYESFSIAKRSGSYDPVTGQDENTYEGTSIESSKIKEGDEVEFEVLHDVDDMPMRVYKETEKGEVEYVKETTWGEYKNKLERSNNGIGSKAYNRAVPIAIKRNGETLGHVHTAMWVNSYNIAPIEGRDNVREQKEEIENKRNNIIRGNTKGVISSISGGVLNIDINGEYSPISTLNGARQGDFIGVVKGDSIITTEGTIISISHEETRKRVSKMTDGLPVLLLKDKRGEMRITGVRSTYLDGTVREGSDDTSIKYKKIEGSKDMTKTVFDLFKKLVEAKTDNDKNTIKEEIEKIAMLNNRKPENVTDVTNELGMAASAIFANKKGTVITIANINKRIDIKNLNDLNKNEDEIKSLIGKTRSNINSKYINKDDKITYIDNEGNESSITYKQYQSERLLTNVIEKKAELKDTEKPINSEYIKENEDGTKTEYIYFNNPVHTLELNSIMENTNDITENSITEKKDTRKRFKKEKGNPFENFNSLQINNKFNFDITYTTDNFINC